MTFKILKRVLALTLCFSVVPALFACDKGETELGATDTTDVAPVESGEQVENSLAIVTDGSTDLTLWFGAELYKRDDSRSAILTFSDKLKLATGAELELKSDADLTEDGKSAPAILFGAAAFDEYAQAAPSGENEYSVTLVGNKLIIAAGHFSGYMTAVNEFLSKFISDRPSSVAFAESDSFSGKFSIVLSEQEILDAFISNSRKAADYEALYNLNVKLFGDSLLAGHTIKSPEKTMWTSLLGYKYGWKIDNYAKNGSATATGSTCKYGDTVTQIANAPASDDTDLVIFDGGRNDYSNNVPLGTVDSTDTETFSGALNTIISNLKEKYPNAKLVYIAVWNFPDTNADAAENGITYMSYADAARAVCETNGVAFFASYDASVSGVDMRDQGFRSSYCLTASDISHLNPEGMKMIMPKHEAFIAGVF